MEILPHLWTTGEITRRPEPEGRSAAHFIQTVSGWAPDTYRDDLSLVLKTRGSNPRLRRLPRRFAEPV